MALTLEEVDLLLRIARDPHVGSTFQSRVGAVTQTLSALVPNVSLTAWVANPRSLGDTPVTHLLFRNSDVALLHEYLAGYAQHDPMVAETMSRPGVPIVLSELRPGRAFGRDPFTSDFLGPQGIRHLVAAVQPMPDGKLFGLCLHRERAMGDFTRKERDLLRLAAPDLGRAAAGVLLQERLAELRRGVPAEQPNVGVVLLSPSGEVLHADPGAVELAARLDALPARLGAAARALAREGDTLEELLTLEGGGWVRLRVACLGADACPRLLAVLERLQAGSSTCFDAVASRIGLSPREREVAKLAIRDHGYRHIAHLLGVHEGTVNSFMRQIYRKAGVSSKTELATLLTGGSGR